MFGTGGKVPASQSVSPAEFRGTGFPSEALRGDGLDRFVGSPLAPSSTGFSFCQKWITGGSVTVSPKKLKQTPAQKTAKTAITANAALFPDWGEVCIPGP